MSPAALCRHDPARIVATLSGVALGTGWRVRYACAPGEPDAGLRAAIEQRLGVIVQQMSQWEPQSLLSRFNRAPSGTWFSLPIDFFVVVNTAIDVARRSGGAFDPTHGRAASLLGFGAAVVTAVPSPEALLEARTAAGWRRLAMEPMSRRLRQPGGLWLDFSGIAKGYAVDVIADLLTARGHEDCLVEIGGELVGRGLRADGQPWWVDVELPPGVLLPPLRVGLHDIAIATSGDYVRGRHTIDPRTGHPLPPQVASVTVIADSAMIADAWATALTVLGGQDGAALADREGLAARIVTQTGDGIMETLTPALQAMIEG